MNKLINSPQNLGATPPMEYIDATLQAGYEAMKALIPHGSIFGGEVAAPAFAQIAKFDLQYLEVQPDAPLTPSQ